MLPLAMMRKYLFALALSLALPLSTLLLQPAYATTFTVTNLNDSGSGSLRTAITDANNTAGADIITFQAGLTGIISLTNSLPGIAETLTITGPGANLLTIQGKNSFQLLAVNQANVNLSISGLTFTGGSIPNPDNASALEFNSPGGFLTITNCAFVNNSTPGNKYVIYSHGSGGILMTGSTISYNTNGTGIFVDATPITITNSTISGNSSGILVRDTTATVANSTFANNNGRGIRIDSLGTSILQIKNSIIANNGVQIANSGTLISQGNNLCSDESLTPTASGDLINTDPLLAALDNYGGETQTHALLPGSPAINAGDNTGAPTTDQRGITRPQQSALDIGAYESSGYTLTVSSGDNQRAAINTIFAAPLVVTVTSAISEPVDGGIVTFTSPGSGPSSAIANNPATISNGLATSGQVTANATLGGPYIVTASANGVATHVGFSLTNTAPPTISNVADRTTNEDTATNAIAITIGDVETTASALIMSGSSSDPILVPNENIVFGGTDAIRSVTITPAADQFGSATITLTVTDSDGMMTMDSFVLTVRPVADTPSVTNATTNENTQTTSGLVISRNNADGSEVTHFKITNISNGTLFQNDGITAIPTNSFITFAEASAGLKFTPNTNFSGSGSFVIQAATSSINFGLGGNQVMATITINAVPTPTSTPTPTATPTGTPTATVTPTVTPTSTRTPTVTATPDLSGDVQRSYLPLMTR